MSEVIKMDGTTCNSCMYFKQHYALDERTIFRVYCGHCTYQSVRSKRPDAKICKNYIYKKPDENAFVSKEYLSKRLLEYMLKLELFPTIKDEVIQPEKQEEWNAHSCG